MLTVYQKSKRKWPVTSVPSLSAVRASSVGSWRSWRYAVLLCSLLLSSTLSSDAAQETALRELQKLFFALFVMSNIMPPVTLCDVEVTPRDAEVASRNAQVTSRDFEVRCCDTELTCCTGGWRYAWPRPAFTRPFQVRPHRSSDRQDCASPHDFTARRHHSVSQTSRPEYLLAEKGQLAAWYVPAPKAAT